MDQQPSMVRREMKHLRAFPGSRDASVQPGVPSDVFGFGSLDILVDSSDESHLTWLREFLTPYFELRPRSGHDCRVVLSENLDRYRAVLALGPSGRALDAFALDGRVVRIPQWQPAGAGTWLHHAALEVFYEIGDGGRSVALLSAPENRRSRTALMWVVRELATNRAQRLGGLLLHASAFAVGSRGVVVAGPKRAGKTTLLIHALRVGSARYVANDRVLVLPGAARPAVRGVPTIVVLRSAMPALFPQVADRLGRTSYHHSFRSVGRMNGVVERARAPAP